MNFDATIIKGDAAHRPFADDSFDRVRSNGVLHHTPEMPAMREIRRMLVPGGQGRIIAYNRSSAWFWITRSRDQPRSAVEGARNHWRRRTRG